MLFSRSREQKYKKKTTVCVRLQRPEWIFQSWGWRTQTWGLRRVVWMQHAERWMEKKRRGGAEDQTREKYRRVDFWGRAEQGKVPQVELRGLQTERFWTRLEDFGTVCRNRGYCGKAWERSRHLAMSTLKKGWLSVKGRRGNLFLTPVPLS